MRRCSVNRKAWDLKECEEPEQGAHPSCLWLNPQSLAPHSIPIRCSVNVHLLEVGMGFPGGSDGKESACSAGDPGLIPRSGRSTEGNAYSLQYFSLENSIDRGVWWV